MKKLITKPNSLRFFIFLAAFILTYNVKAQDKTVTEIAFDHDANMETFAFGADISWLSQQESWGTYYCNRQGKKADLMDILKDDFGVNAIRFRVWVNPSSGWSGKNDVINLSKRAHAKGYKIMISFHYSDTWADSQNQTIPAKWTDHSAEALAKNVYDHTRDVLLGLKNAGITPRWVSLGNETKFGMLYETGRTNSTEGIKNFVKFINAGAKAVKEIDENIITIIHLSNGHDESTARNMFTNLEKYGANYDCLGFSCYPKWSHLDITNDANIKTAVNTYLNVFKNLKAKFNKPVMVMETGHYGTEPYDANRFFAEFIKALINDKELGCFYWEPEAFENSGYNLGAWSSVTHQGTVAMDAFKGVKHTKVSKYASTSWFQPSDTTVYSTSDTIAIKIYAKASTTVTKVSNVDLYVNGKMYDSAETNGTSTYYYFNVDSLPKGAYSFSAMVYDNQGHVENTDTISLLKDDVTIFQENGEGFDGVINGDLTIAKKVQRSTGQGYIACGDSHKATICYNAYFPEAGKYTMYVRFHSTERRSLTVHVGDKIVSIPGALSPSNRWAYQSKQFEIDNPGTYPITLKGLTKSYPDIDFVAFSHSEHGFPVTPGTTTGVKSVLRNANDRYVIYDLKGLPHSLDERLPHGLYIKNGNKIML